MPAFSPTSFKNLAPYVFLNSYNKNAFLFKIKGGYQDKYGGLLTMAIMIFVLTQDTEAFTFAVNALQKLAGFNAPTAFYPSQGMGSQTTHKHLHATREQEEFNSFLQKFNQQKKTYHFVMTSEKATQKLNETYPGKMVIATGQFLSDFKAAAKIYHASHLGLNPEDYNMSPENLKRLNDIGLHAYVKEGRPLPSIEFVKDYQQAIKKICMKSKSKSIKGTYSSSGENKIYPARFCYNKDTREIVGFYE